MAKHKVTICFEGGSCDDLSRSHRHGRKGYSHKYEVHKIGGSAKRKNPNWLRRATRRIG